MSRFEVTALRAPEFVDGHVTLPRDVMYIIQRWLWGGSGVFALQLEVIALRLLGRLE